MRILVLQESDWIERGPHQTHHLLERMVARGHEVRVVDFEIGWRTREGQGVVATRRVAADVHKVVVDGGVTVIRPAFLRFPILEHISLLVTHAMEIRHQFQDFRPDVVLGLGILNAYLGIRAAKRHRVPFVHYVIDELDKLVPQRQLRGVARLVEQADFRRADLVLSINEALRDYTIAMGALPQQTKTLRAGIDPDRFLPADGSEVRRRHGLANDDLVLFFMGWLYPFSGLKEVAEAIVTAPLGSTNVKLLAVGKGELWEELNRIASTDRAAHRVVLEPWQPYEVLRSYLAAADICLLPAKKVDVMRNIVPIKMYEYLAAGKPVLATRHPGLTREFGEGHGVVYVDGPEQIVARAMELDREGALERIGREGRAFVSGNDWQTITDAFEAYLTSASPRHDLRK